jgi:L,D-transpeptidase-like protein
MKKVVLTTLVGLVVAASAARPASGIDRSCNPEATAQLRFGAIAYAAVARRTLNAFRVPGRGIVARFERRNINGVRTVFGVLAVRTDGSCRPRWYRVQLPLRPNGTTGWVRAQDVALRHVRASIVIDLSERRLTLYRHGRPVLTTTAAIGSPGTPTPTGRFYVNQRFVTGNPTGVYGPRVVGVSAFSPTLPSWPQGGPIAIHGTNNPETIGFAVSHGCLRIRNEDVVRLFRLAPEGTPVEIRI